MRAPGHPQGCFLTEILMDELADRIRMDPVEFRIKNLPDQAPNAMWGDVLRAAARKRSAGTSATRPAIATPGPIKTGLGCSAHQWGGGGRGSKAHCDINADGSVVMKCGTQDLGTGTRTTVAMVTAETLGLPVSAVKPEIGDTIYPFSGGSGGSTTTASVDAGDPGDGGQGARRAVRESRAGARRRRGDARRERTAGFTSTATRRRAWPGRTRAS